MAATLEEAIALTNGRAGLGSINNLLSSQLSVFNSWRNSFDKDNTNDRTVRNWYPQSSLVLANTPASGNSQQRQAVVNIACRVMYATIAARSAGRITIAQRDAVLGAWNNSFALFP